MKRKWFKDEHGEVFWLTEEGGAVYPHKTVSNAPTRRWAVSQAEVHRAKAAQRRAWEMAVANQGLSFLVLRRQRVPYHMWDELHQRTGMLTLLRCAYLYRPDESEFSTYAVRSLHKEYARAYRKEKLHWQREQTSGLHPGAERTVDPPNHEVRDQVQLVMGELPEWQRAVLALRFWKGLKYAEIAKMIGCSRAVAAYKVRTAIEAARELLCQAAR